MTNNAFDFLFGSWRVHGNVEDNVINVPGGSYRAAAFRSYDPRTDAWSIWWLDARDPHTLDVPVVGSFIDGEGTFVAHDTLGGRPIVVRFRWLDTRTGAPLWEQAFSRDDGQTWEINWTMRFHRVV